MQDKYVDILMEKVREDRYPSGDLMDRIEQSMQSRAQAEQYVEVLFEKMGEARYPSKDLMNRIERVAPLLRGGAHAS